MDDTGCTHEPGAPGSSTPGQPQQPKPEGMTVTQAQDLLALMGQGMKADEQAKVERELYPGGVTNELQRDEVADQVEQAHGVGQGMRWGLLIFLSILLMIAGGVTWTVTRDDGKEDATSAPVPPAAVPDAVLPGEQPAGGPTTSVFVAPAELVGSWICTDGDFGYEFRADGTYTFTSLDSRSEGRYTVSTGADGGSINLLDASDPSGLTAAMIIGYRSEAGSLALTILGQDKQMVPGTMPDPGSTAPPIVNLVAATASALNGRVEAGQPATLPGLSTYVSQTLDMLTATGSIKIDAVAGDVEGRFEVDYACSPNYCDQPNETGSAQVVIDVIDTRPSTYMQDTWAYEGTAHVRVLFDATTPQADLMVPWSWVGEYDTTYYVGLEREWAVFDINLRIPDDEVIAVQIIGPVS